MKGTRLGCCHTFLKKIISSITFIVTHIHLEITGVLIIYVCVCINKLEFDSMEL